MAAVLQANKLITEWLADDPSAEITTIEKSVDGRVTIEEISDSLREYANLFKAGYASPAQTLTLHRAYPDNPLYAETVKEQDLFEKDPSVVGGPASVEMIDREGHLITTNALSKAFDRYMKNPMTRNVMVMHSDIQVGWALPAYISKSGQIYKSGIGDNTLFFITELRDDTKISKRVVEEIKKSRMKSYSIAGSAIRTENVSGNMFKGEPPYMRVDELELAEVTICEKGVNQGAGFDLIKSNRPTKSCADESCFISKDEGHAYNQETQTMSFDEYKNLITARDGKSFAKMFSEYITVYKEGASPTMSNLFKADPPEGMEEKVQEGIERGHVDAEHWEEYKASKKDAPSFGSYKPKPGPTITARRAAHAADRAKKREDYYYSEEGLDRRVKEHTEMARQAMSRHFGITRDSHPEIFDTLKPHLLNKFNANEKAEHERRTKQSDTDSDTKKAMKSGMLHTLLGLSKSKGNPGPGKKGGAAFKDQQNKALRRQASQSPFGDSRFRQAEQSNDDLMELMSHQIEEMPKRKSKTDAEHRAKDRAIRDRGI
jgi:hypothetical protein